MQTYIEDLKRHEGETVRLSGWVDNLRSSGKIAFVILRDGTGEVQVVRNVAPDGWYRIREGGTDATAMPRSGFAFDDPGQTVSAHR